jgi:hypothetical protein
VGAEAVVVVVVVVVLLEVVVMIITKSLNSTNTVGSYQEFYAFWTTTHLFLATFLSCMNSSKDLLHIQYL